MTITRVYQDTTAKGYRVILKNSGGETKVVETFDLTPQGSNECAASIQAWQRFLGMIEKKITYKSFEEMHREYRFLKTKEFNWNKMLHNEWNIWNRKFKTKQHLMEWLLPYYVDGVPASLWLSENTNGSWVPAKGGYRFELERDAVLYKVFCSTVV